MKTKNKKRAKTKDKDLLYSILVLLFIELINILSNKFETPINSLLFLRIFAWMNLIFNALSLSFKGEEKQRFQLDFITPLFAGLIAGIAANSLNNKMSGLDIFVVIFIIGPIATYYLLKKNENNT